MKILVCVVSVFVAAAFPGCASAHRAGSGAQAQADAIGGGAVRDAEIASVLVGSWTPDPKEKTVMDGATTFRADGTGTELMWPIGHPEQQIEVEFIWGVRDGVLTVRPVRTNLPPEVPLPGELGDRIVSFSDKVIVYVCARGYEGRPVNGKTTRMFRNER